MSLHVGRVETKRRDERYQRQSLDPWWEVAWSFKGGAPLTDYILRDGGFLFQSPPSFSVVKLGLQPMGSGLAIRFSDIADVWASGVINKADIRPPARRTCHSCSKSDIQKQPSTHETNNQS